MDGFLGPQAAGRRFMVDIGPPDPEHLPSIESDSDNSDSDSGGSPRKLNEDHEDTKGSQKSHSPRLASEGKEGTEDTDDSYSDGLISSNEEESEVRNSLTQHPLCSACMAIVTVSWREKRYDFGDDESVAKSSRWSVLPKTYNGRTIVSIRNNLSSCMLCFVCLLSIDRIKGFAANELGPEAYI